MRHQQNCARRPVAHRRRSPTLRQRSRTWRRWTTSDERRWRGIRWAPARRCSRHRSPTRMRCWSVRRLASMTWPKGRSMGWSTRSRPRGAPCTATDTLGKTQSGRWVEQLKGRWKGRWRWEVSIYKRKHKPTLMSCYHIEENTHKHNLH